jgi:hypothetical protein
LILPLLALGYLGDLKKIGDVTAAAEGHCRIAKALRSRRPKQARQTAQQVFGAFAKCICFTSMVDCPRSHFARTTFSSASLIVLFLASNKQHRILHFADVCRQADGKRAAPDLSAPPAIQPQCGNAAAEVPIAGAQARLGPRLERKSNCSHRRSLRYICVQLRRIGEKS